MVWDTIMDRFPLTLSLTIGALAVFLIVGLGAGMIAAYKRGSLVDKVATGSSMVLSSFQIYFLGPIALTVLVYQTGWMEDPKYVPFTEDPVGWLVGLSIPMVVMATIFTAQYTRMARASMIEQLAEEHVRTARAKGMSQKYVFFRYAWRGSLIPIVTVLGIDISALLGGGVVTELTFSSRNRPPRRERRGDQGPSADDGRHAVRGLLHPAPEHSYRHRVRLHRPARPALLGRNEPP